MHAFAMMLAANLLVMDAAVVEEGHNVDLSCGAVTGRQGVICAQQATSPPMGSQQRSEDKRELAPRVGEPGRTHKTVD